MIVAAAVIGNVRVYLVDRALMWSAGLAIDADGAPDAYAPPGSGLKGRDALPNAGRPGNWWGLATDSGKPDGEPIVQGEDDPCPGFYVSPTALCDPARKRTDPRRYVDSGRVPYLAISPELRALGARMGDVAHVLYRELSCPAIVADAGPRGKIGEGSIALANALGISSSPRHGGVAHGVSTVLFLDSAAGWPRTHEEIARQVAAALVAWGGSARLAEVLNG